MRALTLWSHPDRRNGGRIRTAVGLCSPRPGWCCSAWGCSAIVRWESVMIAVLGAVFGIVVGTVFGWMTVRALADQGLSTFAFPTGQVAIAVVAAALAAVLPARRAARVDVLRAIATT